MGMFYCFSQWEQSFDSRLTLQYIGSVLVSGDGLRAIALRCLKDTIFKE